MSEDDHAVYHLLTARAVGEAAAALEGLPTTIQEHLNVMSPLHYLPDIHAPVLAFCHDQDDLVIPVGE